MDSWELAEKGGGMLLGISLPGRRVTKFMELLIRSPVYQIQGWQRKFVRFNDNNKW